MSEFPWSAIASLAAVMALATTMILLVRESRRTATRQFRLILQAQEELVKGAVEAINRRERRSGVLKPDPNVSVVRAINRLNDNIALKLVPAIVEPSGSGGDADALERVVGEISHSLNSPLHQIELFLAYISSLTEFSDSVGRLDRARESIDLCRAVLTAYRDITGMSRLESSWDIKDLAGSLRSTIEILMQNHDSGPINATVVASRDVPGYSNYYLLATLLPILENAIERVPVGGNISCVVDRDTDDVVVTVKNNVDGPFDLDLLRTPGYTSKDKSVPGLGLTSVRTLLARYRGTLAFDWDEVGALVTTLTLPARVR